MTPEGSQRTGTAIDNIAGVGLCITWIALYIVTLGQVAKMVGDHLLTPAAHDGYVALIALLGFIVVGPVALFLSFMIPAVRNRWWLFLGLAPLVGAVTALVLAIAG